MSNIHDSTIENAPAVTVTEPAVREALLTAITSAEVSPAVANFVVRGQDGFLGGELFAIDFERDVAEEVVGDVLAFARNLAERELVAYDPSYQPSSGQALFDDLGSVPGLEELHRGALAGTAELDAGDRGETAPIAALVHRIEGEAGSPLVVYRLKGPGIATRRPRGILIFVPRDGIWVRVPDELLYYQARFDVLVIGEAVIVTAPSTLQRSLGSDARARKMATETFRAATSSIDIEGRLDLAEAIGSDPAMIAKMAQLSRTLDADPEYATNLTTAKLLAFLDDNPQIPIATAGEGQARHLVFESSPQKRYLIPKALADDFLRSELTSRRYEAGSKQRIDG